MRDRSCAERAYDLLFFLFLLFVVSCLAGPLIIHRTKKRRAHTHRQIRESAKGVETRVRRQG